LFFGENFKNKQITKGVNLPLVAMIFAESDEKSVIVCGICGKSKKTNFFHRGLSPVNKNDQKPKGSAIKRI
jgi:hypothetical protein